MNAIPPGSGDGRRGCFGGGQKLAVARAKEVGRLIFEGAASRRTKAAQRMQSRSQQRTGACQRGGARASRAGVRQRWSAEDGSALPARGPPGQGEIIRAGPPLTHRQIGSSVDWQKINRKGARRGEEVSKTAGAEPGTRRPQPK